MLLALDTSTRQASVAVCQAQRVLAQACQEVTTHSEGLLPLIDTVMNQAGCRVEDLEAVVCGRGPGSFTGLRIGMATAKGICLAAEKPLVCVSSLLPLGAAAARTAGDDALVAAVLDARRSEVFCALFRGCKAAGDERVLAPDALVVYLREQADGEELVLAGDGALLYQDLLLAGLPEGARLAPEGCHQIQASYLAQAAWPRLAAGETDDLPGAEPLYIRPSDAKLPAVVQKPRE